MITFITWLRCLAAMLITNSHYLGIYPTDIIANGGLLGDIIFFCVSGYCLTNLRTGFFKWYTKRVSRIFPVVILISIVYLVIGQYDFSVYASGTENTLLYQGLSAVGIGYPRWISWFVYPTMYHFVASILVLYIPYYFILKNEKTRNNLPMVMAVIFAIYLAVYILIYDRSYYHIDTVREPFIRFLYMESMLLGAYFKLNDSKFRNKGKSWLYLIITGVLFVMYFVSKILMSRLNPNLQIINQLVIFALLFFVMRWASSIDSFLEKLPKFLHTAVGFIAKITLEIYLVQNVLIEIIRDLGLFFPLNWVVLTALIVISAFVLHLAVDCGTKTVEKVVSKIKKS